LAKDTGIIFDTSPKRRGAGTTMAVELALSTPTGDGSSAFGYGTPHQP
jgi:hypothetical protein